MAIVVAVLVPIVGWLLEAIRGRARLHGFANIAGEIRQLADDLNGDVDRDQTDLLIHGSFEKWPVLVRFSHSSGEPGVHIQIPVPSNLTLFCYPASHKGEEGQTMVRTSDEKFMSRFHLSTNNSPLEVSMILSSPEVVAELGKICDSQTSLALENRSLDLSSREIIPGALATRLMTCVRGMARVAREVVEAMGSGELDSRSGPKRPANWFRITYLTAPVLILAALGVQAWMTRPAQNVSAETPKPTKSSIPDALATQIPNLQDWHVAEAAEFDADASAWLQQQGQRPTGHVTAAINDEARNDEAYVLKRSNVPAGGNGGRFVLFVDQQTRYDAELPQIDALGKISKDRIGSVEWRGRGPISGPDGDGIILIQRYNDPTSALIFFMSGPKLLTGVPKDFRTLSLE